ncbi:endo-beta-N-acetylglucosaminidase H [Myceligenerans pegani]|uniref:Chitinase n=1 Tax=Myceligenerans pegani TaxID=2776917 RepID=A0ABR9N2B7_9MICO|nr:endo-beta-N-acetylglucosaminidase H [Myceligenerans sp. TRM 65318]MBE1877436.1 chitinase [Myceligenerans sp. TRM 65318]MBE3019707.1 chitinase [Myceligenerans sp. TRM 65318]
MRLAHRPHTRRRALAAGIAALAALSAVVGAAPATATPGNGRGPVPAASGTTTVAYVEVNSNSIANVGRYSIASTGEPVFDIGIIFAANINYDGENAYLYLNPQVQATLDDADTLIRPLQAKGIKVYLSILGNHQGAGFANFPDRASAAAFAQELADVVDEYGLDGIDFDDEWANYGANGTGQPNDWSFVYLVDELRDAMPDKDISLYMYGPSSTRLEYDGIRVGDHLDYAWNSIYGTWDPPSVPGLTKAQEGPAAVNIAATSPTTMASLARRTVREGYGVYLTYNLTNDDQTARVSSFTQELYGSPAIRD